jgi:excisionase family DNA binding protein
MGTWNEEVQLAKILRDYTTREEVAAFMGVTVSTIDRWVGEGRLQKYKIAGTRSLRFKRADVMKLLEPVPLAACPHVCDKCKFK